MTQIQFNQEFKRQYPDFQTMTLTDRRLTYNDLIQTYYNSGLITSRQRENWGHPSFLTANKYRISFARQ